jgi:hypothetical protein
VAKRKPAAPLRFDFGFNRKPRRRPSGKRTPAQQAAYQRCFGKGKRR